MVDAVLYPLWDATFAIGHQVMSAADALDVAREDLATATSILDWRHLAGDRELTDELLWRTSGSLFASSELVDFYKRLEDDMVRRHERFGDSVYLLEPEVKNGPGGLRDLDVFRWAATARYGTGELDGLVRSGALLSREAHELGQAQEMLWQIRNLLHAHAGRRSDRLTFEEQELIAELHGYGEGGEAVERFMSAYYRAARVVARSVTMIMTRAAPAPRKRPKDEDLGGGLRSFDGAVTVTDVESLRDAPSLSMRALAVALDRSSPLLPFLRDRIMSLAADPEWCERLRADSSARRTFVELVSTRREGAFARGSVLREIHDLGLLTAMIPEFLPVVGRVHHDLYHVYTVDVHSVAAVDKLAALARGDLAPSYPLASRLAVEAARPAMLAFATLLHDVGKAIGGKDHSVRGAEMARDILARLDFKEPEIDSVARLIHEHLTMYRLATRRDVDDPATALEMAAAVQGTEGLRALYLLTVVDVSTTSPTSMTSWKAHMLDELYLATDRTLSGDATEAGRRAQATAAVHALAVSTVEGTDRDERLGFLDSFLASMPERYVFSASEEAVIAHAELAREAASTKLPAVGFVPSSHAEAAELCVVAPDRPGLLAMIAAAIGASRLEVHAAQIFSRTTSAGAVEAVDLFWVRDRTEGVEGARRALGKLKRDLTAVLDGSVAADSLVRAGRGSGRGHPTVKTRVAVDHRASPLHTVIEVTTLDRPGLLFAVARALFELGLGIAVAKINTEGARVADVFYVAEWDGSKVEPGPRSAEIEARLLEALTPPPTPLS